MPVMAGGMIHVNQDPVRYHSQFAASTADRIRAEERLLGGARRVEPASQPEPERSGPDLGGPPAALRELRQPTRRGNPNRHQDGRGPGPGPGPVDAG